MRTEKKRENGYLLPVVSVCTGRQVRSAPPSCCHCLNIIHMYLHFRQTVSTVFPPIHCFYTNIDNHVCPMFLLSLNLVAHSCNTRAHHQRRPEGRGQKKDIQISRDRTLSRAVNLWKSVRIPSRFISAFSFQLLSRRINGSRVFLVCWLDKVCTEDEGSFMVH